MVRGNFRGGNNSAPARTVTPANKPAPAPKAEQPTTLSARFAQLRQESNKARQAGDRFEATMARRTNAPPVTKHQRQEVVRGAMAGRGGARGGARGGSVARGNGVQRGFITKRGGATSGRGVVFARGGARGAMAGRGNGRPVRGLSNTAGRGRGRGQAGRGRGGTTRGRGGKPEPLSQDALDKELDEWMMKDAGTAAQRLDADLDSYMAGKESMAE